MAASNSRKSSERPTSFKVKRSILKQCERDLLTLLRNIKEGVFVVDLMGRIAFFNGEAERITGFSEKELRRQHFRTLLALDDLGDGFKLLYETLQGNYPNHNLFRIRKKDRSTSIVDIKSAPFHWGGKLRGAIAFFHDVTEQKSLEAMNRNQVENFRQFEREIESRRDEHPPDA